MHHTSSFFFSYDNDETLSLALNVASMGYDDHNNDDDGNHDFENNSKEEFR